MYDSSDPMLIAPPSTKTNSNISAIGVTAVVMMVSGLRTMWRSERPVRAPVSLRTCVVIEFPFVL